MRPFIFKAAITVALGIALSACGGGGNSGSSSPGTAQSVPAQYAGVYVSNSHDPCVATGQGVDSFVVDSHNVAFRGCGDQYWTGLLAGTLQVDPNFSGAVSGNGSASLTTYSNTGAAGASAALAGTITGVTRALSGIPVTYIDFKQLGTSSAQQFQAPTTALQTITRSYTTFSGTYVERWAAVNPSATSTLTVKSDGTFSAKTKFGTVTGQVTNFDSGSGVHNVQATLAAAPGSAPVTMTGVLSPAPSLSGSTSDYTGVMLGLSSANLGFSILFLHTP
jgi:hypothetical protein